MKLNWEVDFVGSPFIEFQAKMKKIRKVLSRQSEETYSNFFQKVATFEDIIRVKETQLEI